MVSAIFKVREHNFCGFLYSNASGAKDQIWLYLVILASYVITSHVFSFAELDTAIDITIMIYIGLLHDVVCVTV